VPPVWQTTQPDHGVRERPCAQVATRLRRRERSACRGSSEAEAGRTGSTSLRCGQRRARGEARLRTVGTFSQLKLSENQAKATSFVSDGGALSMRSCRQRLPRVRSLTGLGNSEIWAKTGEISACASTAARKPAWTGGMNVTALLKSGASRLEKASRCNGNGAVGKKLSARCPIRCPRSIADGESCSEIVIEMSQVCHRIVTEERISVEFDRSPMLH